MLPSRRARAAALAAAGSAVIAVAMAGTAAARAVPDCATAAGAVLVQDRSGGPGATTCARVVVRTSGPVTTTPARAARPAAVATTPVAPTGRVPGADLAG